MPFAQKRFYKVGMIDTGSPGRFGWTAPTWLSDDGHTPPLQVRLGASTLQPC